MSEKQPGARFAAGKRAATAPIDDFERAQHYIGAIPGTLEGARNTALNGVAFRLLERFDVSKSDHQDLCRAMNAKNSPPLPEHEVLATAQSAWRGAIRKHAGGTKRTTDGNGKRPPVRRQTGQSVATEEAPGPQTFLTPGQLLALDTTRDVNNLLGSRWVCRGGSCLWLGLSGVGKSTLCLQAAVAWTLGMDFFGIRPERPLVSLIVQGENDDGDLAEQMQGLVSGLAVADRVHELNLRLKIVRECALTGDAFAAWLSSVVSAVQPDLVWLDPLNCYIGGDVSNQEVCSHFLRNLLNPIAQDTGCAMMIVHHGNKPAQYQKHASTWNNLDYAYFGSGSSELANWARAAISIRGQADEDSYELRASKRGSRAGMVDDSNRETSCIYLQHSRGSIFWTRCTTPSGIRAEIEDTANEIVEKMTAAMNEKELRSLVFSVIHGSRAAIYKHGCKAFFIMEEVKRLTHSVHQPGIFKRNAP